MWNFDLKEEALFRSLTPWPCACCEHFMVPCECAKSFHTPEAPKGILFYKDALKIYQQADGKCKYYTETDFWERCEEKIKKDIAFCNHLIVIFLGFVILLLIFLVVITIR